MQNALDRSDLEPLTSFRQQIFISWYFVIEFFVILNNKKCCKKFSKKKKNRHTTVKFRIIYFWLKSIFVFCYNSDKIINFSNVIKFLSCFKFEIYTCGLIGNLIFVCLINFSFLQFRATTVSQV